MKKSKIDRERKKNIPITAEIAGDGFGIKDVFKMKRKERRAYLSSLRKNLREKAKKNG